MSPRLRGKWEDVLGRCVSLVVDGSVAMERFGDVVGMDRVDLERAGW